MIKAQAFLTFLTLVTMIFNSEISWYTSDTWNNENVSFYPDKNVMYFNSGAQSEIATAYIEIPEGCQSFRFSVEIGNASPLSKPGCRDSARVEIGFADENYNVTYRVSTQFISDNDYYKVYSVGEPDSFLAIPGNPSYMYVTCEGNNAENNAIDAFFRNFTLCLSENEGTKRPSNDLFFSVGNTTDAVRETGNIVLRNIFLIALTALLVAALYFGGICKKEERKSQLSRLRMTRQFNRVFSQLDGIDTRVITGYSD